MNIFIKAIPVYYNPSENIFKESDEYITLNLNNIVTIQPAYLKSQYTPVSPGIFGKMILLVNTVTDHSGNGLKVISSELESLYLTGKLP